MITYAINWVFNGRRSRMTVSEHRGQVILSPGKRKVTLGRRVRTKVTVIDDTQDPPRILREDHDVRTLRKLGANIPTFLIDTNGNLVNAEGVLFHGP